MGQEGSKLTKEELTRDVENIQLNTISPYDVVYEKLHLSVYGNKLTSKEIKKLATDISSEEALKKSYLSLNWAETLNKVNFINI